MVGYSNEDTDKTAKYTSMMVVKNKHDKHNMNFNLQFYLNFFDSKKGLAIINSYESVKYFHK